MKHLSSRLLNPRNKQYRYLLILTVPVLVLFAGVWLGAAIDSSLTIRAETAFLSDDLDKAFTLYLELFSKDNSSTVYLYNAAYVAALQQNSKLADSLYHALLRTDGKDVASLYQIALLALDRGEDKHCIEILKQAVASDRKHVKSLALLARLSVARGDYVQGLELAQKAYNFDKLDIDATLALAACRESNDMIEEALQLIDQTALSNPRSVLLVSGYEMARRHDMTEWIDFFANEYKKYYPNGNSIPQSISRKSLSTPDDSKPSDTFADTIWLKYPRRYTYSSKWGIFRLGTLTITTKEPVEIDGINVIPVEYRIISNPLLPFISVDDFYCSYLHPSLKRTVRWDVNVKETWWTYDRRYTMDYENNEMIIWIVDDEHRLTRLTQELPADLTDGTSLLIVTRNLVRRQMSEVIVTLIDYNYALTTINFTGERDKIKIAGEVQDCWVVDGNAGFTGVAGLSGNFRGWFTTDDQAIPLKARLKIFLGSITLKLTGIDYTVQSLGANSHER